MRIGEVAAATGASVRSLRYYEERRLLTSERSPSGQRWYGDEAIARVRFIQQLFAAGLSSRDIATLLPCVDRGGTSVPERAMLEVVRAKLVAGINDLGLALARLDELIAADASSSSAER